jgi:hypothetical protein
VPAANSRSLLFRNFGLGYVVREARGGTMVLRLDERQGEFLQVEFLAFSALDGVFDDTNAVKVLVHSATWGILMIEIRHDQAEYENLLALAAEFRASGAKRMVIDHRTGSKEFVGGNPKRLLTYLDRLDEHRAGFHEKAKSRTCRACNPAHVGLL